MCPLTKGGRWEVGLSRADDAINGFLYCKTITSLQLVRNENKVKINLRGKMNGRRINIRVKLMEAELMEGYN